MKPDKSRETRRRTNPWRSGDSWRSYIASAKDGWLGVIGDTGTMTVHFHAVGDRLRPWKVVVETATAGPVVSEKQREQWEAEGVHYVVTPEMLATATAPLIEAETLANRPESWEIGGGGDFYAGLPDAPNELVVPDTKPYPPKFWEDVAASYLNLVVAHHARNPAVLIANETGAPVATVRGWIAKCRQLGLIAKAKQGRVG
jgi:hypothetical protein